jgi:dipeptidyl aminopeptidase/acylaminoacyl peptidase
VTFNSMTRPNEDHILRLPSVPHARAKDGNPHTLPSDGDKLPLAELTRITGWASKGLQGKLLSSPESFWFDGAAGDKVMGWMLKPPGFRRGEKGKWPLVLLIHGGPQVRFLPLLFRVSRGRNTGG